MKPTLIILAILGAGLTWWAIHQKNQPPQIAFTKVTRETVTSNLITNGKAEPIEWQDVRVDNQGLVTRVPVKEGQAVSKGALLAQLSEPGLSEELSAAQARAEQARASLQTLNQGGRTVEIA